MVGSVPLGSSFGSRGLEVELDEVGLVLDRLDRLVERLHLAADQEMAVAIHVQDQAIFRDARASSTGRAADSATGRWTR